MVSNHLYDPGACHGTAATDYNTMYVVFCPPFFSLGMASCSGVVDRRDPSARQTAAKGIYRDPVRSSQGHFVKASGVRWLSLMLLVPVSWADRVWALPFLTVLCPSERYYQARGRAHQPLLERAQQMLRLVARWVPTRSIVVVADQAFSALAFLDAVRHQVAVITRLRLDAALFEPAPPRPTGLSVDRAAKETGYRPFKRD